MVKHGTETFIPRVWLSQETGHNSRKPENLASNPIAMLPNFLASLFFLPSLLVW